MVFLQLNSRKSVTVITLLIILTTIDSVFSEDELQKCIRYINQLYNETNPLEIFKKGFLSFSNTEIEIQNARLAPTTDPTTDPDELPKIIKNMNKYTKQYFIHVRNAVKLPKKHLLPLPYRFCNNRYRDPDYLVALCAAMVGKKIGTDGLLCGGEVFDTIYERFTTDDIHQMLLFTENLHNIRTAYATARSQQELFSSIEEYLEFYSDSLSSYYSLFVNILNDANVRRVKTPEQFCLKEICGTGDMSSYCVGELGASTS